MDDDNFFKDESPIAKAQKRSRSGTRREQRTRNNQPQVQSISDLGGYYQDQSDNNTGNIQHKPKLTSLSANLATKTNRHDKGNTLDE